MLVDFFLKLREAGVPVSITEYLALLDALDHDVCGFEVEDFYFLARAALVKDERHFDRFDLVFGAHFKGVESRSRRWPGRSRSNGCASSPSAPSRRRRRRWWRPSAAGTS